METIKKNQTYRDLIEKTEIKEEILKDLISKVDPNFVTFNSGSGVGHAKA